MKSEGMHSSMGSPQMLQHVQVDLDISENNGRPEGLFPSASQCVGAQVIGYFSTKSDFVLAVGMGQSHSKEHIYFGNIKHKRLYLTVQHT